ncbi:hypothetical protein MLD38_034810 [Melastoma candidum]|uniref:Uncharacterized protein n=1 Tax=Melastoma candidum TaxID=119954 RepID=A0ACB9MBN9_9MYRT|nr:hypothetical protein MLD38_034810 [Melastoma candidum]
MQRDFERAVTLDIKDTKSHPIPPFLLVSSRVLLLPVSILLPSSFGEPATPYHHLGPGSVGWDSGSDQGACLGGYPCPST